MPARAERSRRDDAETAALVRNGESSQRAGSELPAVVSVESSTEPTESSRRGDAEQPVLTRTEESSHRGDADRLTAEEPERSVVSALGCYWELLSPLLVPASWGHKSLCVCDLPALGDCGG